MANNPYGIYSGVVNNGTFQSAAPSYLSPVTMAMLGMDTSKAGNGQQYNTGNGQWEAPTGVNANITGARVGPPGQTNYAPPPSPDAGMNPASRFAPGSGFGQFNNTAVAQNGGDYDPVLNPGGVRKNMTKPMQISGSGGPMADPNQMHLLMGQGGQGSGGLTGLAGANPQLMQQLQRFMASFSGGQNPAARTNSGYYQPGQGQMGDVQPVGMGQPDRAYSAPDMTSTGGLNGLSRSLGNNSDTGQSPYDLRGIFGRNQAQSYGARGSPTNPIPL